MPGKKSETDEKSADSLWNEIEENRRSNLEGPCDLDDVVKSEIGLSPLNLSDRVAVTAHHFREFLLGDVLFFSYGSKPFPECLPRSPHSKVNNVHY